MKKGVVLILIIFFTFFNTKVNAQTTAFMISSVGPVSGGTVSTTAMATAINLSSVTNCIDVKSGLVVLNGIRNTGEFAMSCEVNLQINKLGIRMFPNPVETTTKVKLTKTLAVDQYFNVSIWNTEGVQIKNSKELGSALLQGITMDLSFLMAGTYVLKVESQNYVDVVKFIKP